MGLEGLIVSKAKVVELSLIVFEYSVNADISQLINNPITKQMALKLVALALILVLAATRTYPLYKQCDSRWGS